MQLCSRGTEERRPDEVLLRILVELVNKDLTLSEDYKKSTLVLQDRLLYVLEHLEEVLPKAKHVQLQSLDWGLKSIGLIEFKQLRRNLSKVLGSVALVADGGYFDWTPL